MSCKSRVHISHLLHVQVLYFKCGCTARVVNVEDFSYMHTIRQHNRLSLAREEGDPTEWDAGSDFGGAGSRSGLLWHKLSPRYVPFTT